MTAEAEPALKRFLHNETRQKLHVYYLTIGVRVLLLCDAVSNAVFLYELVFKSLLAFHSNDVQCQYVLNFDR